MSIDAINRSLVKADLLCDRIPVISTISSIINIFNKCILALLASKKCIHSSHYFTHLDEKSTNTSIILLIPFIGNLVVYLLDKHLGYSQYENGDIDKMKFRHKFFGGSIHEYVYLEGKMAAQYYTHSKLMMMRIVADDDACLSKPLQWASPELQNDPDIVSKALQHNGLSLEFVSPQLKIKYPVVHLAVRQNGLALQFASESFRDNKEIALAAVSQNGLALQFVSPKLRMNPEVVRAAVSQNGLALQFASEELRKDHDVVLAAVKQNIVSMIYASPDVKASDLFFRRALECEEVQGTLIEYAYNNILLNRSIAQIAVRKTPYSIRYINPKIEDYRALVLSALRQEGRLLMYLTVDLQGDSEIVAAAFKSEYIRFENKDGTTDSILFYATQEMQNNVDLVKKVVERDPLALECASLECQDNEEIVRIAARKDTRALQFASRRLRGNPEIIAIANASTS